jgi:glycosyltransferase involved in cell wall biosynthesis
MKKRIVVVMPAYNAEKTLEKTYKKIPKGVADKVIVVDDASQDRTEMVAKRLKLEVVEHPQNRGYGANQKTCYTLALNEGADVVVMLHPDYQYDPALIPELVEPIVRGRCDIMLGSRIRTREEAIAGGMPGYKYLGNRFLTLLENLVLGLNLSEYHTGFRAFSKNALTKLPFHKFSDDFVFDQETLISAANEKMIIGEIAVPVAYFPEASSINFKRSVVYGLATLWTLTKYILHKTEIISFNIFA